ncbi:MAG: hypothetical protein HQK54_17560, partial [Oligoflexales bacterium]|nr:hypothetical protein [Oligoflexales bacterium]
EDCTQSTITMNALRADEADYQTEFLPPQNQCLEMNKPWMVESVVPNVPNNFQCIKRTSNGQLNVMWGEERFTIKTTVARESGKILYGTQENRLTLKMKIGCDANLENCQVEMPYSILRTQELKLDSM